MIRFSLPTHQHRRQVLSAGILKTPASGIYNFSSLLDANHAYEVKVVYDTMIADIGNGCSDTLIDSVYVLPQPAFTLFTTDDSTLCNVPATIHFQSTGDNDINQWHWSFGTGDTSIQQNPNYTYNGFGIFDVQLVATTTFGCNDTITHFNYIQIVAPTVSNYFTQRQWLCKYRSVHFHSNFYKRIRRYHYKLFMEFRRWHNA